MKIAGHSALPFLFSAALLISASSQAQRHHRDRYRDDHRYHYRNDYNYRYHPVRAQSVVYNTYPRRQVIPYRGHSYYYDNGFFYRPYGSYVQVVVPPIGIRIGILPRGYRPIYRGSQAYFYYNGIFYRQAERDYEVVRAPLGAELPELPDDARVIVIDDEKYYESNGNYYKERIRSNGETWYEVVGKNGRLYTDADTNEVSLGTVVNSLPAGSKVVIINNEKFYVSPDHIYYQELIENNQLLYKVTGIPQDE
jgi:hypothetical protein